MKKLSILLCVLLAFTLLAGCGKKQYGSAADYRQAISNARPAELNEIEMYGITTGEEDSMYDTVFSAAFGFDNSVMERYAISINLVITKAYGVAIILPVQGKQQEVIDQVNAYVEMQRRAQENYLPEQYEIALGAIVKTAPTGEVLLAMCEDAPAVMAAMEAALK